MSITPEKIKIAMGMLKKDLGGGLLATDIWNTGDSKSVAFGHEYNKPSKTIAILNEVTGRLGKALKSAGFPGLGNYYFINLANNRLVVVLSIDTYQHYILVDLSKTSMGILMSVALPNLLGTLVEAEAESEAAVSTAETAAAKFEASGEKEKPDQPRKRSAFREFLDAFTKGMYYPK